jgi:hypothetical protein
MIIPQDNGKDYRIKKFIEYQYEVPPVHRAILIDYAKDKQLNKNDIILLSWLMSNTYHELTSILMFEEIKYSNNYYKNFKEWYLIHEKKIQFGSAKKYNAMNYRFLTTIEFYELNYGHNPYNKLKIELDKIFDPKAKYEYLIAFNKTCKNHGRFSSDLFNEMILMFQEVDLLNLGIKSSDVFDWHNCANLTSAILNLMYKDNLADKFDKGLMTSLEINKISEELNNKVLEVKQEIYKTYNKEIETSMFVTKLCSFRNLFKNNRYGGYHHDRQLEYLIRYNNSFPEKKELWKKILNYRKINFKKTLLGELNGWRGVRKNRKKLWTQTGYTGVEYESLKYV